MRRTCRLRPSRSAISIQAVGTALRKRMGGSRSASGGGAIERARAGSVGQGGRCGSIIDHYVVACPEAKYDIFIDAYICPLPQ